MIINRISTRLNEFNTGVFVAGGGQWGDRMMMRVSGWNRDLADNSGWSISKISPVIFFLQLIFEDRLNKNGVKTSHPPIASVFFP
jgi:hypothetical protein